MASGNLSSVVAVDKSSSPTFSPTTPLVSSSFSNPRGSATPNWCDNCCCKNLIASTTTRPSVKYLGFSVYCFKRLLFKSRILIGVIFPTILIGSPFSPIIDFTEIIFPLFDGASSSFISPS